MTTRESLLQAIYDNPDEDDPRLIYADFLQEYGETQEDKDREELIRLQYALQTQYSSNEKLQPEWMQKKKRQWEIIESNRWNSFVCPECNGKGTVEIRRTMLYHTEYCRLCRAAKDLFHSNHGIHDEILIEPVPITWRTGFIESIELLYMAEIFENEKPTRRVIEILKKNRTISKIKLGIFSKPTKIDVLQIVVYENKPKEKSLSDPKAIKRRYSWKNANLLPQVYQHCNKYYLTENYANEALWKAIATAVKEYMKENKL